MKTIDLFKLSWQDTPEYHQKIHEGFTEIVNANPKLRAHRDYVEKNMWGFGERSFHEMWAIIVNEMPDDFIFMEIGVFRGQVLSLIELLATECDKKSYRVGITPLDSSDGHWVSDYQADIYKIHFDFNLIGDYAIIKSLSTDPDLIESFREHKKPYLDILYIDGGHTKEDIQSDLKNYLHLVKQGGILVIDDCCNSFNMPFGYFQGIQAVTNAVDELLPPFKENPDWEFLFNVVHNRVYRKIK